MATRLQADEAGKESKWADIDDDEDDWAPETVEWMDGTKTSVLPADNQPPPPEPLDPVPAADDKPAEPVRPVLTNLQKSSLTSTNKTILKPGVHLAKGVPDKPTLVAKPPVPTSVKSPWAPLPPVDKVSPVVTNPPVHQIPPSRFSQRDPHGFDALPPAPSPAKEIAADDFNRSWREERGNKELFNSQSGRYEPVQEPRRGSFRHDGGFRQPSVLQRPPHTSQQSPAEPSAAFQTSRSSDGSTWNRARASSNVSGTEAAQTRRMSLSKPQDAPALPNELRPQPRRDPHSPASAEVVPVATGTRPGLPAQRASYADRGGSPNEPRQPSWTRASPIVNHAQPLSPMAAQQVSQQNISASELSSVDSQPPTQPVPDPVALQQQVMRDKLERARQAKQRQIEEEQREEAAKAERLRLKIASLAPKASDAKDTKISGLSTTPEPEQPARPEKSAPVASPPKPPVPTAEGEVAQYGMMKLHQPQPVKKPILIESPNMDRHKAVALSETTPDVASARPTVSSPTMSPSKVNSDMATFGGDHPTLQGQPTGTSRNTGQLASHLQDREVQVWKPPMPSNTYTGWGNHNIATNMTTHTTPANVWEYPNRSKALGNGTFDNNYMVAPVQGQSHAPTPGPIAPPSSTSKISSQTAQPIPDHIQRISHHVHLSPTPADSRLQQGISQQTSDNVSTSGPSSAAAAGPGPIAPPKGHPERPPQQNGQFTHMDWHNFANQLPNIEPETVVQNDNMVAHPTYKETFKQTAIENNLGKRRVLKTEQIVHEPKAAQATNKGPGGDFSLAPSGQLSPMPVLDQDSINMVPHGTHAGVSELSNHPSCVEDTSSSRIPGAPALAASQLQLSHGLTPPRSSRFFPRSSSSPTSSKSDSPPPPDSEEHPVHAGDPHRPRVSLPVPRAVVKLPPATPPPPKPVALSVAPPRIGSQPIVTQSAWQARFNSLLDRAAPSSQPMPSAPQVRTVATQVLPVSSVSKASLDVPSQRDPATVSLPNRSERAAAPKPFFFADDYSSDVVSKVTAEEDLMDDRQFGSLPIVCLPRGPYLNAPLHPMMMRAQRLPSKFSRPADVLSIEPLLITLADCETDETDYIIKIRLPRWGTTKTRLMRRSASSRKTSGYKKRRDNAPREGNGQSSNPPSRKASTNFQAQSQSPSQQTPPVRNSSPRPPRPNNGWNNGRTAPQGNPWSKRSNTSSVVH